MDQAHGQGAALGRWADDLGRPPTAEETALPGSRVPYRAIRREFASLGSSQHKGKRCNGAAGGPMRRLLRGWSPSQTALRGVWSGADLAISQDILVPERAPATLVGLLPFFGLCWPYLMQRRRRAHRHFGARRDARQRATAKDVGEPSPLLRPLPIAPKGCAPSCYWPWRFRFRRPVSRWFWLVI